MSASDSQFIYSEDLYQLPGRVLVILPVAWAALPENDLALLHKILGSVRLSVDTVQVVHHTEPTQALFTAFKPSLIISFGSEFRPSLDPYQVHELNGMRIIQSDALNALDDVKKKNLWNALKQAFAA